MHLCIPPDGFCSSSQNTKCKNFCWVFLKGLPVLVPKRKTSFSEPLLHKISSYKQLSAWLQLFPSSVIKRKDNLNKTQSYVQREKVTEYRIKTEPCWCIPPSWRPLKVLKLIPKVQNVEIEEKIAHFTEIMITEWEITDE